MMERAETVAVPLTHQELAVLDYFLWRIITEGNPKAKSRPLPMTPGHFGRHYESTLRTIECKVGRLIGPPDDSSIAKGAEGD